MGWDNPPVPWRELARRLSWGTSGDEPASRCVPQARRGNYLEYAQKAGT